MRSVLLGVAHFGTVTDLAVLAGVGAVFLVAGAYCFSRIEI